MKLKAVSRILPALLLIGILTLVFNVQPISAVESPYIAVVPDSLVDPSLTPGENFTVSIYTDYNGSDVWGWQFSLSYNPNVLHGVTVNNGDLITKAKDPSAVFLSGTFDNTGGILTFTCAVFNFTSPPAPLTSGPGTLANVTFEVVGMGDSLITLGNDTILYGYTEGGYGDPYHIIHGLFHPDHIQHGYFRNTAEVPIHDIAVGSVTAPAGAAVGQLVPINVTVANIGAFPEVASVTILYDATIIDSQNVALLVGESKTVSFSWDTTGVAQGIYTLNATATIRPKNETNTWTGDGVTKSFFTTGKPIVPDSEKIYVNQTLMTKPANYTINYEAGKITFATTPGLGAEIKATYLYPLDLFRTDNWNTTTILFVEQVPVHDVAVISVTPSPTSVVAGELVNIMVVVENQGTEAETLNVTVLYDSTNIETQTVADLAPETSVTLSFSWNTKDVAEGIYTITAVASELLGETDTEDNTLQSDETVTVSPAGVHDIAVISVTASPTQVTVGELITINVTVWNQGSFNETFEVMVYYDSITIDTRVESLSPGSSASLSASWNTTGIVPDVYTITAEANLDGDADPANNILVDGLVTVTSPPAPPMLSIKLSGEHDYAIMENVKVRLAALVKDAATMEPVSDANVTIEIYDSDGVLWVSDMMVEMVASTGIYEWESEGTIRQLHLQKGVYLVHVQASHQGGPTASDILEFHIDPPAEGTNQTLYHVAFTAVGLVGLAGLILERRKIANRLRKLKRHN